MNKWIHIYTKSIMQTWGNRATKNIHQVNYNKLSSGKDLSTLQYLFVSVQHLVLLDNALHTSIEYNTNLHQTYVYIYIYIYIYIYKIKH